MLIKYTVLFSTWHWQIAHKFSERCCKQLNFDEVGPMAKAWLLISAYFFEPLCFDGHNAKTRLNPFARSWFYNATAVRSKFKASRTRSPFFAIFQFLAPKNYLGPSSHLGTAMQTTCSPLSFGKSFMKIRSAVPENGCFIFFGGRKKNKKKPKKTSAKHIRYRLIGGCVNEVVNVWIKIG